MLQSKEALDLLGYFDCTQTIFVNPTKKHKNINKYLKDYHKHCKHLQDNGDVELEEQHEGGVVSSTVEDQPVIRSRSYLEIHLRSWMVGDRVENWKL